MKHRTAHGMSSRKVLLCVSSGMQLSYLVFSCSPGLLQDWGIYLWAPFQVHCNFRCKHRALDHPVSAKKEIILNSN